MGRHGLAVFATGTVLSLFLQAVKAGYERTLQDPERAGRLCRRCFRLSPTRAAAHTTDMANLQAVDWIAGEMRRLGMRNVAKLPVPIDRWVFEGASVAVDEGQAEQPAHRIETDRRRQEGRQLELRSGAHRFARLNYANGDMVGHTGNLNATVIGVVLAGSFFVSVM